MAHLKSKDTSICSIDNCKNTPFSESDKCALHCEKSDYRSDKHKGLLTEFFTLFAKYVSDELFNTECEEASSFSKEDFDIFCHQKKYDDKMIIYILKDESLLVHGVVFPTRRSRDPFDYLTLLNLFKSVHFSVCSFYCKTFPLGKVKTSFQNCKFQIVWNLYDYQILEDQEHAVYQACEFYDDVSVDTTSEGRAKLSQSQFDVNCKLHKNLTLKSVDIERPLFSSGSLSKIHILEIEQLNIEDVKFDGKCVVNNLKSEKVTFKDVDFNEKFECKNSTITNLKIKNADFNKVADLYCSKVDSLLVEKSIFNDFAAFEKCSFGIQDDCNDIKALFKYTTFKSFVNFRGVSFLSGISLKNINCIQQPNFLNSSFAINAQRNTDRETFRIIKHSFDAVGNHIEANKYFAYEMQVYRNELKGKKENRKEQVLLWFNSLASNHGQNYIKASSWWLGIVAFIGFILANDKKQWITTYYDNLPIWLTYSRDVINGLALGFLPFSSIYKDNEHLAAFILLSSLLLAGVTWHILVSVRRHSKR